MGAFPRKTSEDPKRRAAFLIKNSKLWISDKDEGKESGL